MGVSIVRWGRGSAGGPGRVPVLLVAVLAGSAAPAAAQSAERAVRAAVGAFGDAYAEADVAALDGLLAEDYVHVNGGSGSVLGRDAWLDWVAGRRAALEAGRLVVDHYEVRDLRVAVHGADAAVATGVAESRGRRDGAAFESRVRFTNVWVRTDDGWKRAAFHDSPVPPPAGAAAPAGPEAGGRADGAVPSDSAGIAALHRRDRMASLAGDVPTLLSLWTDDAVALPPRGPVLEGRDQLSAMLDAGGAAREVWETVEYVQDFGEVMVLGEHAWDWATYRGRSRHRETGEEVSSRGKLLRILKRAPDGSWLVHRSIWNVAPPEPECP